MIPRPCQTRIALAEADAWLTFRESSSVDQTHHKSDPHNRYHSSGDGVPPDLSEQA